MLSSGVGGYRRTVVGVSVVAGVGVGGHGGGGCGGGAPMCTTDVASSPPSSAERVRR